MGMTFMEINFPRARPSYIAGLELLEVNDYFFRSATFLPVLSTGDFLTLTGHTSEDRGGHSARLIRHSKSPHTIWLALQSTNPLQPQGIVIDLLGAGGAATVGICRLHQTADCDQLLEAELINKAGLVKRQFDG